MTRIIEKSIVQARTAISLPDSDDLKERLQLSGIVREIVNTLQGTMTSTAGGAISGFAREAPLSLVLLFELSGNFALTGRKRQIVNAVPQDLYWPLSFLGGAPGTITRTSTGASATDPIRAVLHDMVQDPSQQFAAATYIDVRLYNTLDFRLQWGANADLATTNLSAVAPEWEFRIKEEVGADIPSPDAPHFEPAWVQKQHGTTTSGTRLTGEASVSWDGLAIVYFAQQHDDSAVGDAERVDGLVRILDIEQAGAPVFSRITWQALLRLTQTQYPLGLTTAQPAGVIAVTIDPPLDSRRGAIAVIRDTASANPAGITDIAPAASDRLVSTLYVVEPNPAMDELLIAGA